MKKLRMSMANKAKKPMTPSVSTPLRPPTASTARRKPTGARPMAGGPLMSRAAKAARKGGKAGRGLAKRITKRY